MGTRALIYYIHKCFSLDVPRGLFGLLTIFVTSRGIGSRPYRNIQLVAYPPHGVEALAEVVDALELLRGADPRRFGRVERHIRHIVLRGMRPLGFYRSLGRVCGLRKQVYRQESRPLILLGYAAVLVHEATHGFLDRRRFPYTRTNRKRIERLCLLEHARFLAKFPGVKGKLPLLFGYGRMKRPV